MLTNFARLSRTGALMSTVVVFALTLSLLIFPAAASNKSAWSKSAIRKEVSVNEALSAQTPQQPSAANQAHAQETYGKLGLTFEANYGQTDEQVNFITRAGGATAFLTPTAAVFVLQNSNCEPSLAASAVADGNLQSSISNAGCQQAWALRMTIEGASPAAATGLDKQEGIVNYFIGNDPDKWHTDIPTFARVHYPSIYPGVDLVYYGNQQQLEYDFAVQPGADAGRIALNFEGASSLALDSNGDLLIETGVGTVRQRKPTVYQNVDGGRQAIESGYTLKGGGRVGFRLGAYDRTKSLIIDPVLAYSTYLGANGFDEARGIAVDYGGNAYVVGQTDSAIFPTTPGAFQTSGGTGFVTKVNAPGSARIYSTYFGGGNDAVDAIAVDSTGNAYLTGFTQSSAFPTTPGAFDTTLTGPSDSFVTKLNATGSALIYSTYLGGSSTDGGKGIAVDSVGNAYVIGQTSSSNFPLANAIDDSIGGVQDDYVTKLNAAGTALVYSTYLGGDFFDSAGGIAVDSAGNAYLTGLTGSTNFPLANPIQSMNGGNVDAFVTKLNAAGNAFAYSTYLGGSGSDEGRGIAVDSAGNAYVTGITQSTDFPKKNAIQTTLFGVDAFVTKLNAAGSASVYSTLLGGDGTDNGNGVALDAAGNVYIVGNTNSTNFPTANPIQSTKSVDFDVFVTKLDASAVIGFSTYLGGNGSDAGKGIAVDSAGNAYVTGTTTSTDFPRANPIQPSKGFNNDAFVSKIGSYVITGRVVDSGSAGMANISVSLSGASSATTTTDGNGNFLFLNTLPFGNYTVTPFKTGFTFSPATFDTFTLTTNQDLLFIGTSTPTPTPTPAPAIFQFSAASYSVNEEAGEFQVIVTRSGDTLAPATVDYATSDGTANDRGDYATAFGRLRFGAGDTAKAFNVFITDDVYKEGNETINISLSDPSTGAQIGGMATTLLTIVDNDLINGSINPIDGTAFFVRQEYIDFLNRAPDASGLAFWVNNIESCGSDASCRDVKRVDTSAAFFLSIEFQQTGFLVERIYRAALNRYPRYREFVRDTQEIGLDVVVGQGAWQLQLEANQQQFAADFAARADFAAIYSGLSNEQYVDALNANTAGSLSPSERNSLIAGLNSAAETRATVLRKVADDADFIGKEFNPGFVLMEYIGYLRRNPDDSPDSSFAGFNFWLAKLNLLGDFRKAEMVKAFLSATEHRSRFGPP